MSELGVGERESGQTAVDNPLAGARDSTFVRILKAFLKLSKSNGDVHRDSPLIA
ncbi:MAG: hypothetical protein ACRDHN_01300 [Thermomicrobiales bacterium]